MPIAHLLTVEVLSFQTDDREVENSHEQNLPSIVIGQSRAAALSSAFAIQEAKHSCCLDF